MAIVNQNILEQGYQNALQSPDYYKGLWTTTPAAPADSDSNWFQNLGGWKGVGGTAAALGTTIGNARYGVYDYADPTYWMADGRESAVGNTMNGVGVGLFQAGVQSGNPMLMAIGGGAKAIGGLWNSAFGKKWNKDNIAKLDSTIAGMNSSAKGLASADNNNSLISNWNSAPQAFSFNKSYIGKDGWFTHGVGRKFDNYQKQMADAGASMMHAINTGVDNIGKKNRGTIYNSSAFGGPLDTGMSAVDFNFMSDWLASKRDKAAGSGRIGFAGYPGLFAYGGGMHNHGADWSNGAVHIDAGGSHEENPNEGVQIGTDSEGVPNLVEEGEVIYNDYVYSNRIEMDNAAKERFHINKKRDITYAEMARKLEKESEERPNDPISKRSLDTQMAQLAEEQERQKQEQKAAEAQQMFASLSPEEQVGLMQQLQAEEQVAAEQQMAEQQAMQTQAMPQEQMPQGMEQQPIGVEAQMMQAAPQETPIAAFGGPVNRYAEGGPMSAEEELQDIVGKGYNTSDTIFRYLQGKYLRTSDADLRKLANEMVNIQQQRRTSNQRNRLIAEVKQDLIERNPELGSDAISKLAVAIADSNPRRTASGNIDIGRAIDKFIPTFNFSYENYEKYVKKLTDLGVDFDTALMLVSSKDKNFYKSDVDSKRRRIQYEDRLRNKFTAQNNIDASAAQSQSTSQYSGISTPPVGLDGSMQYSTASAAQNVVDAPVGIVPVSDVTTPIAAYTTASAPRNAAAASTGSTPRAARRPRTSTGRAANTVDYNTSAGVSVNPVNEGTSNYTQNQSNDFRKSLFRALGVSTVEQFEDLLKQEGINLNYNNFKDWNNSDASKAIESLGNLVKYDRFNSLLAKDNPALADAISRGYDFGIYSPANLAKATIQSINKGNWKATNGAGWFGSDDLAYQQAVQGLSDNEIKALTTEQLAERMKATDAYRNTSRWLENSDNALLYLNTLLNDPDTPEVAKQYARKFVTDGRWNDGFNYDYATVFGANGKGVRETNPGTYWHSVAEANRGNVSKNLLYNDERGRWEELVDPAGYERYNSYSWADPENNYVYNYFRKPESAPTQASTEISAETEEEDPRRIVMNHRATWPRYAGLFGPAVGLGMMAAGIGKPDYAGLDAAMEGYNRASGRVADYKPIGNYLTYRPMDIWSEQNRLDANARATDRALVNSGLTAGNRIAGLLANGYNNQIANAELHRKALEYNDALNKQVADFNRGTDMFNAQAYNQTSLANAHMLNQDRQFKANLAADIARTKMSADNSWYNSLYGNVAGLFKGLSDLGRENYMYNQAIDVLGSGAQAGVTKEKLVDAGLARYVTPEEYERQARRNRRGLTFLT